MSRKTCIDDLFPRPWLRAEDIKKAADVEVAGWENVDVYDQRSKASVRKAAVSFRHNGKVLGKRLILNVTQAESFADVCGSRFPDDWSGKLVSLSVGAAPNGKATIVVSHPAAPAALAAPDPARDDARDDAGYDASVVDEPVVDDPLADIAADKNARDAADAALENLEDGEVNGE